MDTKEQYMREAFTKMQDDKKGMSGMTQGQLGAAREAIGALSEALDYFGDTFDLRISDMDRLRTAFYKLSNNFDPEPNEYQAEAFVEYGLTEEKE
tara:strand:+ start:406 stop:690 length:285 start_codon:yes stop_codon:yes gene_type:complete